MQKELVGKHLNDLSTLPSVLPGFSMKLSCVSGWRLVGAWSVDCKSSGEWSADMPTCVKVQCSNVVKVFNGRLVKKEDTENGVLWKEVSMNGEEDIFMYGDELAYTCDEKHRGPSNISIIRCLASGEWSVKAIECERTLEEALRKDRAVEEKAEFKSEWSFTETCVTPDFGNVLFVLTNDLLGQNTAKQGMNVHGDTYHLKCPIGHVLQGNDTLVCGPLGQWSSAVPFCTILFCPQPLFPYVVVSQQFGKEVSMPSNSNNYRDSAVPAGSSLNQTFSSSSELPFATVINITCFPGYRPFNDQATTVCLENGQWNEPMPTCEALLCPPINLPNARVNSTLREANTTVEISCSSGHELQGRGLLKCSHAGVWSPDVPHCLRVQCPWPVINKAIIQSNNNQSKSFYMDSITVKCIPGYRLNGSADLRCGGLKAWLPAEPFCKTIKCQLPPSDDYNLIFHLQHELLPRDFKHMIAYNERVDFTCREGFKLVGENSTKCLSSGSLSHAAPPRCRDNQCETSQLNATERVSGLPATPSQVGDVIVVKCVPGYELKSSSKVECLSTLQWSSNPVCEAVTCPRFEVEGGRVVGSDWSYKSVLSAECVAGFALSSRNRAVVCGVDGLWNESTPTCGRVLCHSPPNVPNGKVSGTKGVYNESLKVTCEFGYELVGANKITCLSNKNWSKVGVCRKIFCREKLNKDEHLTIFLEINETARRKISSLALSENTIFHFNATVEFECERGFKLEGQNTSTCTSDGRWSNPAPHCSRIVCSTPPLLHHSRYFKGFSEVTLQAEHAVDTVLRIQCEEGFQATEKVFIKCMENEEWNQTSLPNCKPIVCARPKEVENGLLIGSNFSYGSKITYGCRSGYELVGGDERKCLLNSTWSGVEPSCSLVRCPPLPPVFQARFTAKTFFVPGDQVIYDCEEGHELVGASTLTCGADKEWVGKLPVCKEITCLLPAIEQSEMKMDNSNKTHSRTFDSFVPPQNNTEVLYGTLLEVRCKEGYDLVGADVLRCSGDRLWHKKLPTCRRVVCSPPPGIDNSFGSPVKEVYHYKENFTYTCDSGFRATLASTSEAVSSLIITCKSSGVWSDLPKGCFRLSCENIPAIPNAQVSSNGTLFESVVFVQCHRGYRLVGPAHVTCLSSALWSHSWPRCEEVRCGEAPSIEHSHVSVHSFEVGGLLEYECETGYREVGNAKRTCNEDGVWTHHVINQKNNSSNGEYGNYNEGRNENRSKGQLGEVEEIGKFRCEKIECARLNGMEHGVVVVESTLPGAEALYVCHNHYKLIGNKTRVCKESGEWSGGAATCEEVLCPELEAPNDGTEVVVHSRGVGAEVVYKCKEGFLLEGSPKRVCLSTGRWSAEEATCRSKSLRI